MRVEEAKTKICPFMSGQFGTNALTACEYKCITTQCMAWITTKIGIENKDEDSTGYCVRLQACPGTYLKPTSEHKFECY